MTRGIALLALLALGAGVKQILGYAARKRALATIRAEVESRQEDVQNLTTWTAEMTDRMAGIVEELQALNVDTTTLGNLAAVTDALTGQAAAALRYQSATDNSVSQVDIASSTAQRNHEAIDEAVNNATVPMAHPSLYQAE